MLDAMGQLRPDVARSHAGADRNNIYLHHFLRSDESPAHTRARIETFDSRVLVCADYVARSHAGADRNLQRYYGQGGQDRRPLTRGRGSKPLVGG